MSIASPFALGLLMSISSSSEQRPLIARANAIDAPTFPAPRTVTFFPFFSFFSTSEFLLKPYLGQYCPENPYSMQIAERISLYHTPRSDRMIEENRLCPLQRHRQPVQVQNPTPVCLYNFIITWTVLFCKMQSGFPEFLSLHTDFSRWKPTISTNYSLFWKFES